ncbi:MSP domain protein, partial [Ancylostoma caninum]
GAKPAAAPAAKAEEKPKAEGEKKEDAKQEPSKQDDKKSGEQSKDDKKKDEKSDDKKEEELKVDPTPPTVDDDKKQKSKQGEPSVTKSTMGKPDENIKLSASSLAWEDKEAQQVLKVTNNSEKKQALKIKCSNNSVFKVNPVFGMIEVGKTLDIVVTRKNGPLKTEKLLILTTPFDGDEAEKAYEDKELIPACATVPMVPK